MGELATSPLTCGVCPTFQSEGQNQKWCTCGRMGYITPAVWGVPNASKCETKSEVDHMWVDWLHHPCRLGARQRFRVGDKIRSGPHVGGWATSPLPSGGSPTLQRARQNQKWPTCGQISYITPTDWAIPNTSEKGTKSQVAHMWADWLHFDFHITLPCTHTVSHVP